MSKLKNVKILDMVNGEPTRVEYDGVVYEKTEDEAKAGDLVRVVDGYIGDVEEGEFYKLYIDEDDDLVFDDDLDDARPYDAWTEELEVFRAANSASTDLERRVIELERRLDALERLAVGSEVTDEALKTESAPKFEVGDFVVALPEADDIYGVTTTETKLGKVTHVFSDGDIDVEVIAHTDEVQVGEEFVVTSKYFRKATDEEIRWAKIGRKPGEFKKGDIVRYKKAVTDVLSVTDDLVTINQRTYGGVFYQTKNDNLTLIVPVEQRFDLASEPKAGVH
jgi:hypothetical protein